MRKKTTLAVILLSLTFMASGLVADNQPEKKVLPSFASDEYYYTTRKQINLDGDTAIGKLAVLELELMDILNGSIICSDETDFYLMLVSPPIIKITYGKEQRKMIEELEIHSKRTFLFRITGFKNGNPEGELVAIDPPGARDPQEAKVNLSMIATAEISYFAEKGYFARKFDDIGWHPQGNNRYVYFLNSCDELIPSHLGFKECPAAVNQFFKNHPFDKVRNFYAIAAMKKYDGTFDIWAIDQNKDPTPIPILANEAFIPLATLEPLPDVEFEIYDDRETNGETTPRPENIKFIAATPNQQRLCPPDMVFVPAGEFTMGSDTGQGDEKPVRKVFLDAFLIDKHVVTNEQYAVCVQSGKCSENQKFNGFTDPQQPVVGVDWNQADTYCKWAGKRLPTEAQWEKAARGTDGRKYPWGSQEPTCNLAVFNSGGFGCGKNSTWPVGSKPAGVSPYGATDMAGNVWQWVADWYDANYYQSSPNRNPKGPDSGQVRVLRGGSWDGNPSVWRTSFRSSIGPVNRNNDIGFRCAKTP